MSVKCQSGPVSLTVPIPLRVSPVAQWVNRYSPVNELNLKMSPVDWSCRETSYTVTVKLQVAVLPEASVATQVTVVVPSENTDPDAGVHTTDAPEQLLLIVGVE